MQSNDPHNKCKVQVHKDLGAFGIELTLDRFALDFDSVAKIIAWALTDRLFDRQKFSIVCKMVSLQQLVHLINSERQSPNQD